MTLNQATTRIATYLAIALAAACSGSGNSGGDGSAGMGSGGIANSGGNAGSAGLGTGGGAAGGAGASGSGGAAASGGGGNSGSGGGPSGQWSLVAEDPSFAWSSGQIAAHPTEPNTIAVMYYDVPYPNPPEVVIAVSKDLGKTSTRSTLLKNFTTDPGSSSATGFRFDPVDVNRIVALVSVPYGLPFEELYQLVRSTDGGKTFTSTPLCGLFSSCPPRDMQAGGGWLALENNGIWVSTDFGASFPTKHEPPCSGFSYAVHPKNNGTIAYACDDFFVCTGGNCSKTALPGGVKAQRVDWDPHNDSHLVAMGGKKVFNSTDGGKSFSEVFTLSIGVTDVLFDPRPGSNTLYLHDRAGNTIQRSTDGGVSFADVTPPTNLDPKSKLSTIAYAMAVAADGAVVALSGPGILRMAP